MTKIALYSLLIGSVSLASPAEAGLCQKILCASQAACTATKKLTSEIIATRGARIFVREPKSDLPSWISRMGIKVVPTLFTMTLLVSTPAWWLTEDYIEEREESANQQIDLLIDHDIRFEMLAIAKERGTLDQEFLRRAGIQLKSLWESYAYSLLDRSFTDEDIRQDVKRAGQGVFPFQQLYITFSRGLEPKPGVDLGKRSPRLNDQEKEAMVRLTHEHNLRLILLNVYATRELSDWNQLKASRPHLMQVMNEISRDPFITELVVLGKKEPGLFLTTYRMIQEDALNLFSQKVAIALGIRYKNDLKTGTPITQRDLRDELVRESHLPIKAR